MRSNDLIEFVRKQPFNPFRLHVTDGTTYDVRHPDQIMVLRSRAIVAASSDGKPIEDVGDRSEHISLVHIVRLEELATGGSEPNGSSNSNDSN